MTTLTRVLAVCAFLGLAACGEPAAGPTSSEAIPLEGAGWSGTPLDTTQKSDKVRVISFFRPT